MKADEIKICSLPFPRLYYYRLLRWDVYGKIEIRKVYKRGGYDGQQKSC